MTTGVYDKNRAGSEHMYRPTLVIGLGGTGTLVLQRLKHLINQKFESQNVNSLFQFLAIDTEPESQSNLQRLDVNEFKNLTESTLKGNDIIDAMLHPETAKIYEGLSVWWPSHDKERKQPFKPGDITHGAKATRCIGRLAFWHHGIEIYRLLERKIRRTLQVSGLKRDDIPSTGNTAKVFIVCSLAGGSGSGMFLDIAYMVRSLLARENLTSFVTGLLLVDPSPFDEIVQEEGLRRRMEANIYAALCELDWMMGGHLSDEVHRNRSDMQKLAHNTAEGGNGAPSWNFPAIQEKRNGERPKSTYEMQYLNRLTITSGDKPFDICYLVSSTNEHARRLREVDSLTEMIAQEIFLEIATPLGRTGRSQLDNVERLGGFSDYRGRPLAYSSFAVASLNITTDLIRQRVVLNLVDRTVSRLLAERDNDMLNQLLGTDQAQLVYSEATQELIEQLPFDLDAALDALDTASGMGQQIDIPDLNYSAGVQGNVYQSEALSYRRRLDDLINNGFQPAYQRAEQSLTREYTNVCTQLIAHVLGDSKLSLTDVITILSSQVEKIDQMIAGAEQERSLAQADVDTFGANVNDGINKLDKALKRPVRQYVFFPTNKNELVGVAARTIPGDLKKQAEGRRDLLRWRAVSSVGVQTRQYLREAISGLRQLPTDLIVLQREVANLKNVSQTTLDRGSLQYQLEFEALDIRDVEALSEEIWQGIDVANLGQVIAARISGTSSRRTPSTPHRIMRFFEDAVQHRLSTGDLSSLLFRMNGDDTGTLERQLKRLIEYAEPFCSLDLTRCPEVKQWSLIYLVGYDGAARIGGNQRLADTFTKLIDRHTPVNTNNPNQIVFLKTKHGLPLFSLVLLNGMMRASYHEHRNAWLRGDRGYRPVHLAQQWNDVQDLNPASPS